MTEVAHWIHTLGSEEFGIDFHTNWMPPGSLENIEETFKTMPKRPTILLFDDVSDELEGLPRHRRKQVFKALTTVRHDVKAPVVVGSAIHYSKALDKDLRNVNYVILTSISDEEFQNINQLWGFKADKKLNQFQRKFETMFEEDYFELDDDNGVTLKYDTNKPLRVCLAKRIRKVNFLVYAGVHCGLCEQNQQYKEPISAREFYDIFRRSYGTRANNLLMHWLFAHGNPEAFTPDMRAGWNNLTKLFSQKRVDKDDLVKILHEERGAPYKKMGRPKKKHKEFVDEIFKTIDIKEIANLPENQRISENISMPDPTPPASI
jgi:hypothetical protein